ncbi:MAG TPA: sigma-70 family RNA polymerase sigma factor, partial [Gemmataceae bacterium]|nr:sigma-70 family RNA polymerase sigma factor [Gemmataceae bacterium]
MSQRRTDDLLHGLRRLAAEEAAALTDTQLLARFAADRDPAAFTALVQRYGRLVHGVCRGVLRHDQDAEDAAQATFLVLARRAGAIRSGAALSVWLYRVARSVALKTRRAAERRKRQEARAARPDVAPAAGDLAWRDLQQLLDAELARLPDRLRSPFVLCVLAGKSKAEAAADLGWKEGTVSSRLALARERLRARLARRGVAFTAVLTGLSLAESGLSTAVPGDLVAAARAFAAGERLTGTPATLARAVARGMATARLKALAVVVVLVGVGGVLAASLRDPRPPGGADETVATGGPEPAPAPEPADPRPTAAVVGTVLGPDGQPMPGVRVTVVASRELRPDEHPVLQKMTEVLGAGQTDAAGGYRVTVPRATPDHSDWIAYVWAPGHALRAVPATADPALLDVHDLKSVRLERGRTVRGRVVDRAGAPVSGLTLDVAGLILTGTVFSPGGRPPAEVPGWPGPRVTAADGTFEIDDLMPGTRVALDVRDARFAADRLGLVVPAGSGPVPDLKVSPPRVLTGRVTAADTGKPLADAVVTAEAVGSVSFGLPRPLMARTDAAGLYTVPTQSAGYQYVTVIPPVDTGYPAYRANVSWLAGADRVTADLPVPPGVVVRGRIVEGGTDRPVPGATVTYEWVVEKNPFAKGLLGNNVALRTWRTQAGPDGSFAVAVRPGPGHLLVKAPTPDFVHAEVSWRELRGQSPGGKTHFPDAVVPLRPVPGGPPPDLTVPLRRGVTVRGRVVGADGKPAADGLVIAPHVIPRGINRLAVPLRLQNGRFEVPGCPPGGSVTLWVHDFPSKSAAVVTLPVDGTEPT